MGAVALAVIVTSLHLPVRRTPARIDYLGAALLAAGLTCVLLVTTWGGQQYAWGSTEIVGLAAAAVILLGAFVAQERRAAEPILPLRLFREPVFDVVSIVLFLTTLSFFAAIVFMPVFLQGVTGASATDSGLLLLPLLLAGTGSTAVAGRLMSRTGRYKIFPVVGLGLMSVGLFLLSRMDANTSQASASLRLAGFCPAPRRSAGGGGVGSLLQRGPAGRGRRGGGRRSGQDAPRPAEGVAAGASR